MLNFGQGRLADDAGHPDYLGTHQPGKLLFVDCLACIDKPEWHLSSFVPQPSRNETNET